MQIITDRSLFPKCIRQFNEVRKICVGGCYRGEENYIVDGEKFFAHAHVIKAEYCLRPEYDEFRGVICLKHKFLLRNKNLLLHEVAHLLTPHDSHGKDWKETLLKIGGTTKRYWVWGGWRYPFRFIQMIGYDE